jgi:hypothetical protein
MNREKVLQAAREAGLKVTADCEILPAFIGSVSEGYFSLYAIAYEAGRKDEWQPIETAPDGGAFIVATRKGPDQWNVELAYRAKNGTIRSETGAWELTEASHWIPLPHPPTN